MDDGAGQGARGEVHAHGGLDVSTVEERSERTAPGSEWLAPRKARLLRAQNAKLREAVKAQDVVIRALLAERATLGHREAEA